MKIGLCSANSGPYTTRAALESVAELAEEFGVESVWMSEHPVLTDPQQPPSPMDPGDPILDPLTTLAFLAGRTRSVRLGSGVIVLPFRNPLVLAKELATVDVLSDGRLIFGIGVGYVEQEFSALGVPFARRGERTEEYFAAMRAIWTQPHPSYQGELFSFAGVQANPRPLQRPHPPVVVGGYAPAVMRRAVRDADGWYGWGLDHRATARYMALLRAATRQVARREDLGPLEITITPPGDVDVATAADYADLGVGRLNLMLPWEPPEGGLASFFGRVVRPLVEAYQK
jgi:probable F420-dependent oxidoreductase